MIEKVIFRKAKKMVNYFWKKGKIFPTLEVKPVYGVVFTNDKRVVLRLEDN